MAHMDVIRLDDHRPVPAKRPPRRLGQGYTARQVVLGMVVIAGLFLTCDWLSRTIGWAVWELGGAAVELPVRAFVALAFGVWIGLESAALARRPSSPIACEINVHVFEDDTVTQCRCGQVCNATESGDAA